MKEHQDACRKYQPEKSAIAEHAWGMRHPIVWESAKVLDSANNQYTLRWAIWGNIQFEGGSIGPPCGTTTLELNISPYCPPSDAII